MAIALSIETFLRQHNINYELVSHPRSVSSMRIAELAHVPGAQLAKSVLLEDESGYLMAVIPSTHREYAENAFNVRGGCGFSFGNGCSEGISETSLFGSEKKRTIPIKAAV